MKRSSIDCKSEPQLPPPIPLLLSNHNSFNNNNNNGELSSRSNNLNKYTPRYDYSSMNNNLMNKRNESNLSTPSILNKVENEKRILTTDSPIYDDDKDEYEEENNKFEDSLDMELNQKYNNNNNISNENSMSNSLISVDINNIYKKNKNKLNLLEV